MHSSAVARNRVECTFKWLSVSLLAARSAPNDTMCELIQVTAVQTTRRKPNVMENREWKFELAFASLHAIPSTFVFHLLADSLWAVSMFVWHGHSKANQMLFSNVNQMLWDTVPIIHCIWAAEWYSVWAACHGQLKLSAAFGAGSDTPRCINRIQSMCQVRKPFWRVYLPNVPTLHILPALKRSHSPLERATNSICIKRVSKLQVLNPLSILLFSKEWMNVNELTLMYFCSLCRFVFELRFIELWPFALYALAITFGMYIFWLENANAH